MPGSLSSQTQIHLGASDTESNDPHRHTTLVVSTFEHSKGSGDPLGRKVASHRNVKHLPTAPGGPRKTFKYFQTFKSQLNFTPKVPKQSHKTLGFRQDKRIATSLCRHGSTEAD